MTIAPASCSAEARPTIRSKITPSRTCIRSLRKSCRCPSFTTSTAAMCLRRLPSSTAHTPRLKWKTAAGRSCSILGRKDFPQQSHLDSKWLCFFIQHVTFYLFGCFYEYVANRISCRLLILLFKINFAKLTKKLLGGFMCEKQNVFLWQLLLWHCF